MALAICRRIAGCSDRAPVEGRVAVAAVAAASGDGGIGMRSHGGFKKVVPVAREFAE
jgi:hypothetical protein